jgi:hypothetical protein
MTIGESQSDSYYDAPDESEDKLDDDDAEDYPDWVDTLEDRDDWNNS